MTDLAMGRSKGALCRAESVTSDLSERYHDAGPEHLLQRPDRGVHVLLRSLSGQNSIELFCSGVQKQGCPKTFFNSGLAHCTSKNLPLIGAIDSRYFENKSIVLGKTTNEYCPYLLAPWDCSRTKIAKYGQTQLQPMSATGLRRPYSTRSSRSTGPSSRLN